MFGSKVHATNSRKRTSNTHIDEDYAGMKRQRSAVYLDQTNAEQAVQRKSNENNISTDAMQEELPKTSAQSFLNATNCSELPSCSTAASMYGNASSMSVTADKLRQGSMWGLQNNCEMSVLPSTSAGHLYTHDEVRSICQRELQAQEEKLRNEYTQVLNEKLAEQHDVFQTYIQQEINKKNDDFFESYVS